MENYCQLPDGRLLLSDGLNPPKVWDGLAPAPVDAGLPAAASAPTLTPSNTPGTLIGLYQAYVRFLDALGQVSDFSPASAQVQVESSAGGIIGVAFQLDPVELQNTDTNGNPVAHGLTTGQKVKITGATGMTEINGTWTITVLSASIFSLDGTAGSNFGDYDLKSATWVAAAGGISYTIPAAPSARATRVQVLRNTDGEFTTFYVDLDLAAGTLAGTSTNDDDTLATGEAVPLLNDDGTLNAFSHGPAPDDRSVFAAHLGRVFAGVEVAVKDGAVQPVSASPTVQGIGTKWTANLAGRFLYVNGATQSYQIASVDVTNQRLTLAANYADTSQGFALYSIQPAPASRRLIYYSQAGQPESWPATNALSLQEDNDEITGLLVKGSFIYVLEQRHIYRFTFQTDPAVDGQMYLATERGAINNRCVVQIEDLAYMLDYSGVHAFSGGQASEAISSPIQRLFQPGENQFGINWRVSDLFHANHDPTKEILRFFVALGGSNVPRHALCYHYRLKRWWIEEYRFPLGASAVGLANGFRQLFVAGGDVGVWLCDRSALDDLDPRHGSLYGSVSSASVGSLTDNDAQFTADLVGKYVYIATGRGRGQGRQIVATSATTLGIRDPWRVKPDATSVYQIGGIPFYFLSGTFFMAPAHDETSRHFAVYWTPTKAPGWLDLRVYFDNDALPQNAQNTHDDAYEGFASIEGEPTLTVDTTRTDGYAQQRLDNRRAENVPGVRQVSFELLGVASGDGLTISQIEMGGVVPSGAG